MTTRQPLLSVEEVMDFLGKSRPTVQRFIDSGELPAVNLGRTKSGDVATGKHARYGIAPADLDRFLEASRVSA